MSLQQANCFCFPDISGIVMTRYGRAAPKNPIPLFEGPVPPREEFEYDRVLFMPSKDMRPLLVHCGNVIMIKKF